MATSSKPGSALAVNQKFLYNPDEELPQIKLAANPSKCLDVYDGSFENSAKIVLWDCHPLGHPDRAHQAFRTTGSLEAGWPTQIHWEGLDWKCVDLDNGVVGSWSERNSRVITYDCHSPADADYDHQVWVFADGSPKSQCAVQFSSEACLSTPQCNWCGRPPASCYSTVEEPDACAN